MNYLDWRDLCDDEPAPQEARAPAPQAGAGAAAIPDEAMPPELRALLAEKERLEAEMAALTGRAPAEPDDERRRRLFPVKVHTKESRIEERRLRRHDEQLALAEQRARERAALARRAEAARLREREVAAEEERCRRRLAAASEQRRSEAEARAAAERLLHERFVAQHKAALAARADELQRAAAWEEEHASGVAAASLGRLHELRRERAAAEARAEEARAARLAAAQRLVQARRREAQATERRLDSRARPR